MDRYPKVFHTKNGTPYLRDPGVVLLAKPNVLTYSISGFLEGFDESLGYHAYLEGVMHGKPLAGGDQLCKLAGQLCYMSFGPGHTPNEEAAKYFDNIKSSGHGSVLEHANYTMLFWGIDRAVTHGLVRHRAGFGFSQVSQRYVDGKVLRFVERPEFQNNEVLHQAFEKRIDRAASEYDALAAELVTSMHHQLAGMSKRDARKAVNQAARACLPNETEAPIIVTANARGWRHFSEMRAAMSADTTICRMATYANQTFREIAPAIFGDYEDVEVQGRRAVTTKFRKV